MASLSYSANPRQIIEGQNLDQQKLIILLRDVYGTSNEGKNNFPFDLMTKSRSSAKPSAGGPLPSQYPEPKWSECGNYTASLRSYGVPRVTPNLIVVHVHTCKDAPTPQSIKGNCEDVLEFTQEMDPQKEPSTVRNLATGYGSGNARAGDILYRPLTTRVLHEHNLQQAFMARLPIPRHVSQYGDVTILGVGLAPTNDTIQGPAREGSGCFHSNSLDGPSQTPGQQQRKESMFNEAGHDSLGYRLAGHWQSPFLSQNNEMDMLGQDLDQGLTAWGNDLAGIGAHLADYRYQEYINRDELTID